MTLDGSRFPVESHSDRRLVGASLFVVVVWLLLLTRLFYLQVVEGDRYRISAQRNSVSTHRIKAPRGMIFDRTGEILVDSRPSFDVLVEPHKTADLAETLTRIAWLAGADPAELLARVGTPTGRARFKSLRVLADLDRDVFARVESRTWALSGVLTQVTPVRDYRLGESAAHLLGRLGEISAEKLEQRRYQGYRQGDVIGIQGVERLLDRELRGRDGGKNVLVDAHGRQLELLDAVEPQPGKNAVLTLDHRLQLVAERALHATERSGAVVALNPRNGEIFVLASHPAYNPNRFASGLDPKSWSELRQDPEDPLHNRALQSKQPPGSTYKVVTALAGLEEGLIHPEDIVKCSGHFRLGIRRYRCWKRGGHGEVKLQRALAESCDVYFYKLGHELGVDRLAKYARLLGLGRPTGIKFSQEASGTVPDRAWKKARYGQDWIEGETISVAIGQGANEWTPIQLANAYATIANGGKRYRPFIVKRVQDAHGQLLRETEPELIEELAVKAESLELIRQGLHGVVHDPHGTGYVMRYLPGGVEAAGKTGTAQVVALEKDPPQDEEEIPIQHRDHAWFVTYVPAENPRIVVGVLVEHGGHGASAAAPIAREVVTTFLENALEEGAGEIHARN